jgi:hypothetical protein
MVGQLIFELNFLRVAGFMETHYCFVHRGHIIHISYMLRTRNSLPPPAFGFVYEGAIGQQR